MFLLAAQGPLRHRVAQLAKGGLALVVIGLSWITVAGLFPLSSRPYPIGSTNGGVWNVVFGFNGVNRLNVPPTAKAAALDPTGLGRMFRAHGIFYGSLIGTELLAALALGGLALLVTASVARRTTGAAPDQAARLRRAGAVAIGLWLVIGTVLFSLMGRLQPRYLEAISPAVATGLAVGAVTLGGLAARHRAGAVALAAGTGAAVLVASGFARASAAPHAAALLVGAALVAACAALAVPHVRARPAVVAGGLTALALGALLAMPLGTAIHLARVGSTDSGRPGYMPATRVEALSRFLTAHRDGARYEFVSSTALKAGPMIAHDGQPVLILTSLYAQQITSAPALAQAVRSGQVRYALLGPMRCSACIPSLHWARAHATDVGRRAGVGRGLLYRLSTRAVGHRSGS
jgi:hypothetical protein